MYRAWGSSSRNNREGKFPMKNLILILALVALWQLASAADEANETSSNQSITFSVGPDEALTYRTEHINRSDEQMTILPPKRHVIQSLLLAVSSIKKPNR